MGPIKVDELKALLERERLCAIRELLNESNRYSAYVLSSSGKTVDLELEGVNTFQPGDVVGWVSEDRIGVLGVVVDAVSNVVTVYNDSGIRLRPPVGSC